MNEWMDDALCAQVGADIFFPDDHASSRPAKKICAECDVREQCLQFALENGFRTGVWGGLDRNDRRKLVRK